jgi:DMSO/TMAO reductase YedYZ molybdopterin-dependent catalytic subunit
MGKPYTTLSVRILDRRVFLRTAGLGLAGIVLTRCAGESDKGPVFSTGSGGALDELAPISDNDAFYVVWFSGSPDPVEAGDWACTIAHEGEPIGQLDMAALGTLTARTREHTLQCIESRPGLARMNNAEWEGLPLREALEAFGIELPQTGYLEFSCADGYDLTLSWGDLDGGPLWLVWKMGGVDLPHQHGAPARILTPGRYGWLNPKSIRGINFTDTLNTPWWMDPLMEYYEKAGVEVVDEDAHEYQIQALMVQPQDLELVAEGTAIRVLGKVFAGRDPIEAVELSTDGGQTWAEATLTYAPGADIWTLFHHVYTPSGPGTHTIEVRARSVGGKETVPDASLKRVPYVGGMTIEVTVA